MKQVVIIVPSGNIDISSITGSFHVLNWANEYWQKMGHRPMIELRLAGVEPELKLDMAFFSIHPLNVNEIGKTDLLIVPSINQDWDAVIKKNKTLVTWIKEQYEGGAEIASICTGAFLLAEAGLLDGKSCSTHWDAADKLKQLFPTIRVHTDILTVAEKGIYTNGGGYSFLNLALFLVEKYFGREVAILGSKMFQIDMDRTSQSPFAIFKMQKNHGDEMVYQAQTYMEENLRERISFEELASKLATSRRNFDRRFVKATGNTPIEYLQRVKVEVAKSALEKERKTIFEVMSEVGYTNDKAFRAVFKRIAGISPLEYKTRYNKNIPDHHFDFLLP
ncbi:GlxA family transcriptional regulator [Mucilaginibacter sp. 22184]|uniref:GlxA family transcriptional regulator n=1 Tax=Mucilaginibacter sp. 22184 TaxID=3453887 RepID=UPI003F870906